MHSLTYHMRLFSSNGVLSMYSDLHLPLLTGRETCPMTEGYPYRVHTIRKMLALRYTDKRTL